MREDGSFQAANRKSKLAWVSPLAFVFASFLVGEGASGQFATINHWKHVGPLWTWVSGSQTASDTGSRGSVGASSASYYPAARSRGCGAVDSSDNLWLFGGLVPGGSNFYNDFWKYSPSTKQWTWISGSGTSLSAAAPAYGAVYGTKGIASLGNTPGFKYDSACWIDSSGNFWLFGGAISSSNNSNELWKYDLAQQSWIWIGGSSTFNSNGVYGTKGVASGTNMPPSRERMAHWKAKDGTFWFFGGWHSGTTSGRCDDVWKFDPTSGNWTWMAGSASLNGTGTYGTRGVANSSNLPPARRTMTNTAAVDSSGKFWMFGGDLFVSGSISANTNDLWRFDPTTLLWTWVAGSSVKDAAGQYGPFQIPSPSSEPPARRLSALVLTAGDQPVVLFGWNGQAPPAASQFGDVWKYTPQKDKWTWIGGASSLDPPPNWGTKNVPSVQNTPGGRDGSIVWIDSKGTVWLFGGDTSVSYADLWKVTFH